MSYKIGILGGIGPATSAKFYSDIIRDLQVSGYIYSNTDYPHIILNSIPAPELTSESYSLDDIKPYIQGVSELVKHNPKFIVMACNTIHLHLQKIKLQSGYNKILSLRELVKNKLQNIQHRSVCVLATPATINSGLYHFHGVNYIKLPASLLIEMGEIVRQFSLSGDEVKCRRQLFKIVKCAKLQGAECFLLACTEISWLLENTGLELIDTMKILRDHIYQCTIRYLRLKQVSVRTRHPERSEGSPKNGT